MANRQLQNKQDPSLYKIPPQSIEAEESLLSGILIDNNTLLDIIDILSPEDFYRSAHQKIFSGIVELFSKNEPVDLVTLSNALKERGHLEEIGGATYLATLVDTVPLAVNAKHYAKIVHDKATLRRLIEKTNEIAKECFEDRGNVDELVDFAESVIFEISKNKHKQSFYRISELIDGNIETIEKRQGNKTLVTGVPTGFTRLDNLTSGLQKSELIILAARPSMGKTALALNIARNAAVDANVPVAVFSLEMSKEQLSMRLLCSEARIDSSRLRGGFFSMEDWRKLTDAAGVLSDTSIFIDDTPNISAMEIRAKARRLKMEKNIGLVVIDYLQLMKSRMSAERRDLEISEISRSLKALAKELDVPVMALSQLNRMLEQRNDKQPRLSDLRESGALEQDADVVAFIYRDEMYNSDENNPKKGTADILIRKNRNGPTGEATLTFLASYTRFENIAFEKSE
ncbi:MAG: replicative DNA helicase [Proteobacteria bacterium]|nr:replicative DNA helicase [Desulfobacteraceae bacterium]MBU3980167.1 replicative DNA helicase [Pseudomonadota bacterium]MBU4013289.1 replicative DNA helicase [Pseudomonadota bacterium]MBU4068807.1 replicative DNA helicase [Pseudomonadota bacterium]MBU4101359.1 replicative DNA helicase [Pseudomonadota bacterium]